MTEAEWLTCTDSVEMFRFPVNKSSPWILRHKSSPWKPLHRKLLLFASACCRGLAKIAGHNAARKALDLIDRHADNKATTDELNAARNALWLKLQGVGAVLRLLPPGDHVAQSVYWTIQETQEWVPGSNSSATQCAILRDLVSNPFRPVTIDPSWLVWNSGTIPRMAQAIYDERRYSDLPILADALEEASCDNAKILTHCRGPGPHVRGCWVLDLILSKS
jgi:hypothetical protein